MFFALAPGVVAGVMPWLLTEWEAEPTSDAWRVLGVVLVVAGASVLLHAFARFVVEGVGTPAPVAPTRHLVVGGLYRWVRNPMYIAVVSCVAGQALLLGRSALWAYAAFAGRAVLLVRARLRGADAQGAVRLGVRRVPAGGSGLAAASTAGTTPASEELSSSSSPGWRRRSAWLGVRPRRARQDAAVLARRVERPVAPDQHRRPRRFEQRAVGVEQERRRAVRRAPRAAADRATCARRARRGARRASARSAARAA